jgi:hypothetical protein
VFDPEQAKRIKVDLNSEGRVTLSSIPDEPFQFGEYYVEADAYDQLLAFYKAVPHSPGHVDCPKCDATRDAILAGPIPARRRRRRSLSLVKPR